MNDDAFALHRSLLFTVAYEMLGSAADAEDASSGLAPESDEELSVDSLSRPGSGDEETARELSYLVTRQPWLPLADRQRLLASPDIASRLRDADCVLMPMRGCMMP